MAQTIRLIGVPVDLFLRAAQHADELMREFMLISISDGGDPTAADFPARLLDLMGGLRGQHADWSGGIRSRFADAQRAGEKTIDVELPADEIAADITERLTTLLDEADEFCRAGNLLTIASDPDVVAWRHRWRDQVVGQIRNGVAPEPFGLM